MINYIVLKISSNPLLFLEILILILMSVIVALPLWVYELHQVEKNWLESDYVSNSNSEAALKPEMTNAETCTFDIKYKTPKHKFKRASESSLESLGLISEIDLFGEELDNEEEALQIHSKDDIVPDNIIEVRKGVYANFPQALPRQRRSRLEEPSMVCRLYDVIRNTFTSDYQPLTVNLFQTNITEVDVHVNIDSRIPMSLKDLPRPDFENESKDNYISRQLKLISKDHGDTSEENFFKLNSPPRVPIKSENPKEFNCIPLQLGAVTNLLNKEIFSGQTITENAFSLVKILQNFANAEREHKLRASHQQPPVQKTMNFSNEHNCSCFGRGFFTQMSRNNIPSTIIAKHRHVRHGPPVREINKNDKCKTGISPIPTSGPPSSSSSYANLGFMCR